MNCWEYKNCGRDKTKDCPAYPFNGQNCWRTAGTLCGNQIQGTYAQKIGCCTKCEFYKETNELSKRQRASLLSGYFG